MNSINKTLGTLLAKGLTSEEIVEELQELELAENKPAAIACLVQFYSDWENTETTIDRPDMHRQWHVFMRHHLLQETLKDADAKDIRTALAILDSLAGVQGVDTKSPEENIMPLNITLVPVQVQIPVETGKENEETNDDNNAEQVD